MRIAPESEDGSTPVQANLLLSQSGDRAENAARLSDTSIALDRQWKPNVEGSNSGSETAYLDLLPAMFGTFKVVDEKGTEYTHGSKVPKYVHLTIVPVADEGFEFKSYSLNGESAVESKNFDMPGIYTKLNVNFVKSSGIDAVETSAVAVTPCEGGLTITADHALARIYNASGICLAELNVDGSARAALTPGYYIVVTVADGKTLARPVIVR